MEPQTIVAIGGGLVVIANVLLFWVREWKKHQTWKTNGKDLKEIKEDVKSNNTKIEGVDDKVGQVTVKIAEVKTAVSSQTKHCKQTVQRFDKTIGDQNQAIIDLAGKK